MFQIGDVMSLSLSDHGAAMNGSNNYILTYYDFLCGFMVIIVDSELLTYHGSTHETKRCVCRRKQD